MPTRRARHGPLPSRRAAAACGAAATAGLFVVVWMLLAPHMEAIGGVYRLAASLPSPAADDPALALAVPAACVAVFLAGLLPRLIRGKRTVR